MYFVAWQLFLFSPVFLKARLVRFIMSSHNVDYSGNYTFIKNINLNKINEIHVMLFMNEILIINVLITNNAVFVVNEFIIIYVNCIDIN